MEQYRVYVLDAEGHVRAPPEVIECPDNGAAIDMRANPRWARHRGLEFLTSYHHSRPHAAEQSSRRIAQRRPEMSSS